ncbi:response regulator transcription factor [Cellulomonas sp. B6]|uniref:response regulator transcription factor n=1 Tax=Cellulomonas sp. B6 TaxID=1295626 RepID=UPI00073CE89A|nr:response regulator transcription factor [Cellulomonas sp. B6]KSW29856.1 XRE family transcriptional regulator [Cellulomonas sp. B6]
MARLVVAEDDPKQAQVLRVYAENDGHTVTVVGDGRAALEEVRRHPPDLLLLDVMMPRVDGLDVCRILRAESDVPIVLITARSAEDDVLLGLDLGADDYVTKPYSPRQLMARVRSLLRRAGTVDRHDTAARVGDLVVDLDRHTASYGGVEVECTPGELTVLDALARGDGRVLTREQLMLRLHGTASYVSRRTVDMHVMHLRRKLEAPVTRPVEVATVHGVGYRLLVRDDASSPGAS